MELAKEQLIDARSLTRKRGQVGGSYALRAAPFAFKRRCCDAQVKEGK